MYSRRNWKYKKKVIEDADPISSGSVTNEATRMGLRNQFHHHDDQAAILLRMSMTARSPENSGEHKEKFLSHWHGAREARKSYFHLTGRHLRSRHGISYHNKELM